MILMFTMFYTANICIPFRLAKRFMDSFQFMFFTVCVCPVRVVRTEVSALPLENLLYAHGWSENYFALMMGRKKAELLAYDEYLNISESVFYTLVRCD